MQRNRATTRRIRPIAALAMLDVELIIVKTEPQCHDFPRQVWVDFIPHAGDADLGIHPHLARFRFASKRAKPLPTTHLPQSLGGQMLYPILHARMRLSTMRAVVVAQ